MTEELATLDRDTMTHFLGWRRAEWEGLPSPADLPGETLCPLEGAHDGMPVGWVCCGCRACV